MKPIEVSRHPQNSCHHLVQFEEALTDDVRAKKRHEVLLAVHGRDFKATGFLHFVY